MLALRQTFREQTPSLLSCLVATPATASAAQAQAHLTPRGLLLLALGLLTGLNARLVEWLTEEYAGGACVSVAPLVWRARG